MHSIIFLLAWSAYSARNDREVKYRARDKDPLQTAAAFLLARHPHFFAQSPMAAVRADARMSMWEGWEEYLGPHQASESNAQRTKPRGYHPAEPRVPYEPAFSTFVHAPLSFFAVDQLRPKGPRANADIGRPEDFSRPIAKDREGPVKWCGASVGSWACTVGGWPSPKPRPTTEFFLVLDGAGTLTDSDGLAHNFGTGDVVVLPKGWSGRWDITQNVHKIWCVHDHPDVEGFPDGVVRAVVEPVARFFAPFQVQDLPPQLIEPTLPGSPLSTEQTLYHVGPTHVGLWTSSSGSFTVAARSYAQCIFVVDGVFFLTNLDGSARRCIAGDTIVLPQGWAGNCDIIEPVKTVWVKVS